MIMLLMHRMSRMVGDERGWIQVLAMILVLVIVIAVIVAAAMYFAPSLKPLVCGNSPEEIKGAWFQVVIDSLDPSIKDVIEETRQVVLDALNAHDALSNVAIWAMYKEQRV